MGLSARRVRFLGRFAAGGFARGAGGAFNTRSMTRIVDSGRSGFWGDLGMRAKHAKAPSGKWESPDDRLAGALGRFVMAWSLVEAAIEVGIHKQIERTPLFASIITAGLQFKGRRAILSSLLSRIPKHENAEALRILGEIGKLQDRNDIMHSVIGGDKNAIWFNRRITANEFTSKIEYYDVNRFLAAALECSDLAGKLMAALGITGEEYTAFFQDAHNSANSL